MDEQQMTDAERQDWQRKVDAEIAKLVAETGKINSESRWYPFVVLAGMLAVLNLGDILNTILKPFLGQ